MSDIARAAEQVARSRHVAVLTGAGVSAESGLVTFRGQGGLWRDRDPRTLATPEAFQDDPATVWAFYHERRKNATRAQPNAGHIALAELARCLPRLTLVTQNVDRLHQRAGSPEVIELHGNLDEVRCTRCGVTVDRAGVDLPDLPSCDACGGLLRPGVVWFGEMVPERPRGLAHEAVLDADVLLVVGTSAEVYPAAGLIDVCPGTVIEINLEPTSASPRVDVSLYGPSGSILPRLVPGRLA